MTQKLESYFSDYHEYHTTKGNQICHYIGVPTIVVSLLGLLSLVTFGPADWQSHLFRPDLGILLVIAGIAWNLTVDWKITLPYSLFLFGMYFLGRSLPVPALIVIQIAGWTVQFYGHFKYEKKSPAFLKNLTHLFVGPLWVFSKAVGYAKT